MILGIGNRTLAGQQHVGIAQRLVRQPSKLRMRVRFPLPTHMIRILTETIKAIELKREAEITETWIIYGELVYRLLRVAVNHLSLVRFQDSPQYSGIEQW